LAGNAEPAKFRLYKACSKIGDANASLWIVWLIFEVPKKTRKNGINGWKKYLHLKLEKYTLFSADYWKTILVVEIGLTALVTR